MSFFKLIVALIITSTLLLSSCNKDESSSSAPYNSGGSNGNNGSSGNNESKTNKEILSSSTWKFTQLLVNNNDVNFGSYDDCETDNEWLFREKEYKIISRGLTCKNGENNGGVYKSGSWTMTNDKGFIMKLDNETFTIINISNSSFRIRVARNANSKTENWDYIYRSK